MKKLLTIALLLASMVSGAAAQAPNLGMRWLDPWYQSYNERYFNHELPTEVKIVHTLKDPERMAESEWYADPGIWVIRFNVKFEPSGNQAQMTLIHEMCHIYLEQNGEDDFLAPRYHGPHFQACMLDLAEKGAFNDLW